MALRATLLPLAAEPPAAGYAEVRRTNSRPVLAYDAAAPESSRWTFIAPQGMVAPLSLVVYAIMASATSGGVVLTSALEAVTPADATDLDAVESFGGANSSGGVTVPTGAGWLFTLTIPLTNTDAIAVADYVRLELVRDVTHASDTAAGDLYVLGAALLDAS